MCELYEEQSRDFKGSKIVPRGIHRTVQTQYCETSSVAQKEHGGSLQVSFSMRVVKAFTDPLTRQVNEGVRIANCSARTHLNSKSEWHSPATVSSSVTIVHSFKICQTVNS
jgi:hypothetical protein